MANPTPRSVDEYLAKQPADVQALLKRVRSTVRRALPGAEEVISYGIPAVKRQGAFVLSFAGWKQHCSIYPATARLQAALKGALKPYLDKKATIRFPLSEPIPARLIERIAKGLAREAAERAQAKAKKPKKARARKAGKR